MKTLTIRIVLTLVAILVAYDYYQVRQEALCAHAATVRSGAHR